MNKLSLVPTARNLKVFFACLLTFNILIAPISALAVTRSITRATANEAAKTNDSGTAQPLSAEPLLPGPKPEAAPAPPVLGAVTASMTAALVATVNNTGDGKADPGDTINYTVTLNNTSGASATGLSFGGANIISPYAQLVAASIKSTPVAFDETPAAVNEDNALPITLQAQDPDGDTNLTFAIVTAPTAAMGTLGSIGSPTCDASGLCSASVTYTPTSNFNGAVSFTYKVTDSTGKDSNQVGSVSFTVNAVNDAPSFSGSGNPATVSEDAVAQTVNGFRTNVSAGPPDESGQTVTAPIDSNDHTFLFSSGPTLTVSGTNLNLTYTPKANANGSATIKFHLHDTGGTALGGVDDSAQQTFVITVTAVNDAPVAQAKAFTVQANMKISGLTGLLTGVTDPDATNGAADPLSADAIAGYTSPSVTVTSLTLNTCTNGTISGASIASGTFDFDPPPGLGSGSTCVLNYQVTDTKNPAPGVVSATQTITITAQGPVIWFVDPNRATDGNGTLSNTSAAVGAFNKLSSANAKLATLATNQKVFVYNTAATLIGATEVLDLRADNDWLVGQGTLAPNTATPFDSFFSITPPANTIARPTMSTTATAANAARPTIRGTVTARNNTQVTGVNIDVSGAAAGIKGLSGLFTSGTTLIKDVSVTSGTGNAVDLSGAQTVTFETSDQTNSPNIIMSSTGGALSVVNSTIGANGFKFKKVTTGTGASGPTKGIALSNTGAGPLTITGDGSTADSGGIIQHTGGTPGTDAQAGTGAIDIRGGSGNYSFNFMKVLAPGGDGVFILNSTGTISIVKSTIDHNSATVPSSYGLRMQNGSGSGTLTLDGVLVQNKMDGTTAVSVATWDTGNLTFNVQDSNTGDAFPMKFTNLFGSGMVVGAGDNSGASGTTTVNVSNAQFVVPAANGSNDLEMGVQQNSILNFNIHDNTFDMGNNGANAIVGMINVNTTGSGRIGSPGNQAIINNNIIKNLGQSAALTGYQAIRVAPDDCVLSGGPPCTVSAVTHRLAITNNQIQNVWHTALNISARGRSNLNLQLANNIIGTLANPVGKSNRRGVLIETQAASSVFATITGNTIVNAGTSNSNSALALRAGTDNGEDNANGTIAATMTGNTIKNTASAVTGGWFRAETITLGSGVAAGNMCLDYSSNTLKNSGDVNDASKEFNLLHNSTGTFSRHNGGSNVGTETSTGTITTIAGGCTQPNFAMFKPEGSPQQQFVALLNTLTGTAESQNAPASSLALLSTTTSLSEVLNYTPAATAADSPIVAFGRVEENRPASANAAQVVMPAVTAEARVGAVNSSESPAASVKNSLSSFANAIAAMIEPTAHAEAKMEAGNQKAEVRDQRSDVRLNHARSVKTEERNLTPQTTNPDTAAISNRGTSSGVPSYLAAVAPFFSGGVFPVNGTGPGFTLPNNKTITITFSVTVNNPPNFAGVPPATPQISAQGTLQGSAGTILTDDPGPGGATDPTVLNADLFNTTSTITGASPSNSTNMGQSVTFTASIVENNTPDPAGGTLPGGTATFKDGASNISGCVNVTVTSGAAQCTTAALTAAGSPHTITVVYNGDGNFDPSTSANFTQTVTQNGTTTAVSSSQNPSVSTQNVTFTATVTSTGAVTPPTGTVQFHEGATNYGAPVALTTGGSCPATKACASFSKSDLAVGPHTISGDYLPDPAFTASSGNVSQQVNQSDVTVAVSSSMNPSLVTQGVSFTAQVSSNTVITGPPTGNIQFKDGAANIGAAVNLTAGGGCPVNKACATSSTISTLTAGNHTINAVYNGDTNFAGTTGTLSGGQQVNKSNTATALVSSVNPSVVGSSVKFTATVTSQTVVTGPPAGTAVFFDGATPITCTDTGNGESGLNTGETLNGSGVATCTTSALTVASHNITAQYTGAASPNPNGSDTFNGNTSNTVVQVVNTACTTPITVVNANDAGAGSLRQAIADVCDGGAITFSNTTAGGAVNFYDGSPHTINLADTAANQLTIAKSLTITGPGASVLTVQRISLATSTFRIFEIQPGKTVSISGMTISNGHAADGTGSLAGENGGAILNDGTLTLTTVSVTNSNAGTGGAGGPSPGGNGGKGGGIYNSATGTLTIVNSTISGNQTGVGGTGTPAGSGGLGGGVYNLGTLFANGTTFSANSALGISGAGGGIASASGTLTLINSTISGNTAIGEGGGLLNSGTSNAGLTSVTVSANRSDNDNDGIGSGGGIRQTSSGSVTLSNTIVAGNFMGMGGGQLQVETATVDVPTTITAGSKQVETLTVAVTDGGGTLAADGTASVDVTISGVVKHFDVPVTTGQNATAVAAAIRSALNGATEVTDFFDVDPTAGPDVVLTAKTEAPHDPSLNMALSGTGLGTVTNSTDTTPGTYATVTVTAAGMTNSGKIIKVPISVGADAANVADKMRIALTNDVDVSAFFTVSGSTNQIVLTAKAPALDDSSMNIATAAGTSVGLNPVATSADTTPGVPSSSANDISGTVTGTFNLVGTGGSGTLADGSNNNQVGVNPILVFAGLANNGGPTMTHALIAGSPAIDTGNSALTPLTTLGADVADNVVTTVTVVNGNVIPASSGYAIRVDTEQMIVTARAGNSLTVTRGANGTTAASHSNGTNVYAAVDQRGLPRPVDTSAATGGDESDKGAYEQQNQPAAPGTPNLDDASDTGPNNSDDITSDTTPTFTINGVTSGATVKLYRDDDGAGGNPPAVVQTGIAAGTSIQLTDPNAPASATPYLYSATQTLSGAPESNQSGQLSVTVNTSAPGVPSNPDLQDTVSSDSGASQTDNYTNSNTRVFDVATSETGSTVELLRDTVPSTGAVVVTSAAGNGSGTIQLTDSVSLSDGMYVYSTRQTNSIGLTTNSAGSLTVTIDKTAPAVPGVPVLQTGSNSGSTADNITNDNTPTFDIGGTTTGERVELYRDANFVGFATGNAGTVAIGETTPVTPDGTYNYKARQVDLAGNTSSFSADLPVTIDTVSAPSAPVLDPASDSGTAGDNRTNKKLSRTFNVLTSETGATVELLRDTVPTTGAVVVDTKPGNGSATIQLTDPNTLADGTYTYSTRQTDVAGNIGTSSNLSVVIDTTVTANAPDLDDTTSDKGANTSDNRTDAATPHVFNVVISETNSLVELLRDGTPVAGGSITSSGTVQLNDSDALADGTYQYSVRETDRAGNVNTSANLGVTIDTTAPTVVSITRAGSNPTNAASVNFTVTFSEPVQVSTVDSGDFFISKSGGITTESLGTITPLAPSGTPSVTNVFTVAVNTGSGDGTLRLDVVDNDTILDLMNLPLGGTTPGNGSFNSGEVYTIAKSNPFVQSITRVESNPTNLGSVNYTVTFSQPVTGVNIGANSDFTLTKTGGITTESITGLSGSGAVYTVTVQTGSGDGTLRLNVVDDDTIIDVATGTRPLGGVGLGNGDFNTAGEPNSVFTIDKTAPTVTVNQAIGQSDPVTGPSATIVNFTALFSEAPVGFDNSDVTLTGSPAGSTATITQVDPTTYNIGVSGMTASGTITVSIGANKFTDAAGNSNTSGSTSTDNQVTFNLDNFSTLEVNTTADTFDGSCDPLGTGSGNKDCTLREAITLANADTGAETITFNPTVFAAPGPYTINLTGVLPDLSTDMTISGPGANVLTVQRNTGGNYRIFTIGAGIVNVTISGLTISNGNAAGGGSFDRGGGIFISSTGAVQVNNCTISGNTATADGGGIVSAGSAGTLNISGTTISGNSAGTQAGGISIVDLAPVTITNSTISGNSAKTDGGGIFTQAAAVTITGSTLSNNHADSDNNSTGAGGGLFRSSGTVTLRNTIIGGNFDGGGVKQAETATVVGTITSAGTKNATVTVTAAGMINSPKTLNVAVVNGDNASTVAGKMRVALAADANVSAFFTVSGATNQIILTTITAAPNDGTMNIATDNGTCTGLTPAPTSADTTPAGGDVVGTVQSDGFNLIQSTSGATINQNGGAGPNITGADPQLVALADNGGPTFTHALQCTSPAIDKGKAFTLTTDQRGGSRPFDLADSVYPNAVGGDGSDIGAFETQSGGGCVPLAIGPSPQPSTPEDPASPLTITLKGTYSQNTTLSFVITQQPGNGAALTPTAPVCTFNLSTTCTSTVNYTPSPNFNGGDLFKFKVSASGLDSDEVDVNVTVTSVNDPPVANNDILPDIAEDSGPLTIPFGDLLANDKPGPINETGQNITINSVSNPVGGTVSIQGANVRFTPNLNFYGPASFQYTILDDGTTNGALDPRASTPATVSFNVTPVPDTPSVTPATTNEDTQTTSGLVISRNAVDGAEITNFKITGITNGTLFLNNGSTQINNGDFISAVQGGAGLKFTPTADLFSPTTTFSFQVQASLNGNDTGLGGGLATATITVNAVADTPSVSSATTTVNTQTTSGLVITRNAADSTEVTNFKITNILNGTLFKNDGTTQINNNDFITFAEGNAGLKFTPANNLSSPATTFSFNAQASTSNADAGLGGSTAAGIITVGCGSTIVLNSNDSGAGSLRSIINSACPGGTITFDPSLNGQTITLTSAELLLNKNLTIQGPGANLLTIKRSTAGGTPLFRIFNSQAGQTSTLSGLTINNGNKVGDGGGISNAGTLTLSNVTISGNTSTASGGGVASTGTLTVSGSTFSGNTSPAGSGIYTNGGALTVVNSTFSGNSSDGVSNDGAGLTRITNSTFSGNTIRGITNNTGTVNLGNTIVANTPGGGDDLFGAFTSQGHNLIGNKGASTGLTNGVNGDIVGSPGSVIDPRLAPLANNGGPTQTHALLAGSAALDGGDNALVANPPFSGAAPFNDQRGAGFLRIRDAADANITQTVDIGAFEADPSIEDITDKSTPENAPVSFTFNLGDAATAFDSITTQSSNTTLLPNANVVISGSGSSRTLTLTPAATQTGTSTVTVTVTKTLGGAPRSMSDTFVLTVNDGGNLQFSSGTYSVIEGGGSAGITITRTGGSAGTATIQIATSNGTGVAGTDYTAISQTVTFNDGETSKVVNVPITDNPNNQPNRTVNLTLSNVGGSGQLGAPLTAVLTILDDDPIGGYIKFSAPTYTVNEGAGQATITVQRVGTLTNAVTVDYATSDDSDPAAMVSCAPTAGNTIASSRCDFNTAVGRLTFAAGDGSPKTFNVLINQDTYLEGPESLPLTLSNLTGGATFATPATATLTIIDDDLVAPTTNPIDDPGSFVRQHYHDFLNREPDASGLAFWTNEIASCGGNAACIEIKRINVSAAFFLSIEFQVTGGTAYLTNKVSYGGLPNYLRFETDAQAIGRNYVFGQPGAEAILEANKVAFYNEYVSRTEFMNTYNAISDQEYVNTLISNTGVFFTQPERDALSNGLANHTETRATVLRKVSEKPTFRQAEFNSMFVLMEYFGYLRRNPDTPGFNFWLNKLNQFNGNFINADMVKAFLVSTEYRQRFGP